MALLIITPEQRLSFRQDIARRKIPDLVARIAENYPDDASMLGEPALQRFAALGLERAMGHGLDSTDAISRYMRLMLLLGSWFDEDPAHGWAGPILSDREMPATKRAIRLEAAGLAVVAHTAGEDGALYRMALMRARRLSFDALVGAPDARPAEQLRHHLPRIHPEGFTALGDGGFAVLCARAKDGCAERGLAGADCEIVTGGLMFLMGTGVLDDPLHPWIGPALAEARKEGATALHAAAMRQLDANGFAMKEQQT